ncbi:MAG: DUF1579 family protein [Tepidisphaeraceae bacterium]
MITRLLSSLLALAVLCVASRADTPTTQPTTQRSTDGHALLAGLVGNFKVTTRVRNAPNEPWAESTGREIGQLMLNDRFVQSASVLHIGDTDVRCVTLTGYNSRLQQFEWVALNDNEEAMTRGTGVATADGKGMQLSSEDGVYRFVIRPNAHGYTVEGFARQPERGEEFQFSQERYERDE